MKTSSAVATVISLGILSLMGTLGGCALLQQERDTVYVRKSGDRHFDLRPERLTKAEFEAKASDHWPFAVMSENAYHGDQIFPTGTAQNARLQNCPLTDPQKQRFMAREDPRANLAEFTDKGGSLLLASEGWKEWKYSASFMQNATWCKAVEEGVSFRIYERMLGDVRQITISFRGTVFSYGPNWRSNLRWFVQWPRTSQDGNMVVQHDIADDLANTLVKEYGAEIEHADKFQIFVTGHSLGGAFAQQLAYAFPSAKYSLVKYPGLKISKAIVFDPSPVNGWDWVDPELRERNAGGLPISRIYQHGEILAYLRLSLGYVYPLSDGNCVLSKCTTPKIEEVRYNALYRPSSDPYPKGQLAKVLKDPIGDHSMRSLAAGLASAAGHTPSNVP